MPVVTLRKIFYLLKKKILYICSGRWRFGGGAFALAPEDFTYRVSSRENVLSQMCDLWSVCGLRSTHLVTPCKFYRAVRSHFSKLASSEDTLRSHYVGVVSERSGPLWLCLWELGAAVAHWEEGVPLQAPPAPHLAPPPAFRLWPQGLLSFSQWCLQQTFTPVSKKILPKPSFAFCLVCFGLHK